VFGITMDMLESRWWSPCYKV